MTPIDGAAVLTAAETRAAEAAAVANGATVESLMAAAGRGVAETARRLASGAPVLVLCGPGNNGGDGYVAAAALRRQGLAVRVAALGDPHGDAAQAARREWGGVVEPFDTAEGAPVLVDALFGTGLSRPLEAAAVDALKRLRATARLAIAVDLPSGVASDDGAVLSPVPYFDLTLALGAVKPSHLLQPAARYCGAVRLVEIGLATDRTCRVIARPQLPEPGPDDHKYTRGMVAVVSGAMAGAARLASTAAMRAAAGYVALLGGEGGGPDALVHRAFDDTALDDKRIGALLIGPGLGRDDAAKARLERVLETDRALVIDGDALHLLGEAGLDRVRLRDHQTILTPHAGEFDALFGKSDAAKPDRARAAAERAGAVVVFKGADTVIAAPDGRTVFAGDANDWLSTAGTGDVLAGATAATRAAGLDALAAAEAGVWLHRQAARRCGAAFIADDLAAALTGARAAL